MSNNDHHAEASDFDPYQPDSVPLFEAMYGEHLISLGGQAAIDNMFSDIDVRHLKALDVGFGLGGVAFYLAEKFNMEIAGLEVNSWMVTYANAHKPSHLSNALEFTTYDQNGRIPYSANSFDLVYSKGVMNHVANKLPLFAQLYSVLKPHGRLVIADWIHTHNGSDQPGVLVCESQNSYREVLESAGFSNIQFRDDSDLFLSYTQALLNRLDKQRHFIQRTYGKDIYTMIKNEHLSLIDKISQGEKIATRILAHKLR